MNLQTHRLWKLCQVLRRKENKTGVLEQRATGGPRPGGLPELIREGFSEVASELISESYLEKHVNIWGKCQEQGREITESGRAPGF